MGPSFLRRNLRNGKQLCGWFERVINKPEWAVLVSAASAGKEIENTTDQLQAAKLVIG